jgi:hypothetical protein
MYFANHAYDLLLLLAAAYLMLVAGTQKRMLEWRRRERGHQPGPRRRRGRRFKVW